MIEGELATEGGGSLGDLARRPEPIQARQQRGVQAGGNGQAVRRRIAKPNAGRTANDTANDTGLQGGLAQLLDEERHAVGAGNDALDGTVAGIGDAANALRQRRGATLIDRPEI